MPSGQHTLPPQAPQAPPAPSALPWFACLGLGLLALGQVHLLTPLLRDGVELDPATANTLHLLGALVTLGLLGAGAVGSLAHLLGHWRRSISPAQSLRGWHAMEHLMGAIFTRQGYQVVDLPGGTMTWDTPGQSTTLALLRGGELTLARCMPARADGHQHLHHLQLAMAGEGARHGVLVTPGLIGLTTRFWAWRTGITVIDGSRLRRLVREVRTPVPLGQTAKLISLASYRPSPACPTCGGDMLLQAGPGHQPRNQPRWRCGNVEPCSGSRPLIADIR